MASTEVNVQVAVRCRPLIGMGEELEGPAEFIKCLKEQKQVIVDDKMYSFDYVFDSTDKQKKIYETSVTQIVEKFLQGKNAAVIAYGQTGSGKTFTMGTTEEYNRYDENPSAAEEEHEMGIIPRVLKHIFAHMADFTRNNEEGNYNGLTEHMPVITVSFLEVYNEEVYDILNPSRPKILIRESEHIVNLPNLKEVTVTSYEEAMKSFSSGAQIRTTGATATNAHSSRSHAIFSINQRIGGKKGQNRIMLVDLAGSEAAKKTKTQGSRFIEGVSINRGLLALGKIIRTLSKEKGRSHVPYRDSTLSRLLQTCLHGNSNTLIIACINQVENNILETSSTLQFASNARAVKIKILTGDRETGTPCGWKRPYSNSITPNTVGRSKLLKMQNASENKIPMHSTMLLGNSIGENRIHEIPESTPSSARMELCFSPLPTLEESPVEPVFKKPRTPPQFVQRPTGGFTPYVERICSSFENCIGKLLANRPPAPSPQLDTPTRKSLVDSIARQTLHVLQDCTNASHQNPEQTFFCGLDETVIAASSNFGIKKFKRTTISLADSLAETSASNITLRRSTRRQTMNIEACKHLPVQSSLIKETNLTDSILLSPRRTLEKHKEQILSVLNRADVKQLQSLPHVGPKSALIITNWRTINGPFEDIFDLKSIPGLPKTFMKNFAMKNSLVNHLENSLLV